jgi:hypothetical protein
MYRDLTQAAKLFACGLIAVLLLIWAIATAFAQDKPESSSWWDHPRVRACCGVADAVFADQWHVLPDGSVLATVTQGTVQTAHWADALIGRTYHVPAAQVIDVPGNPTGRALLFVHPTTHNLYCFALGPMI